MRMTKLGHACVRLESGGTTLLLDPGTFSGPDVLDGANAVLITHEHFDHFDADRVRAALTADPGLTVWTNAGVAGQLAEFGEQVRTVAHGDVLDIGGIAVRVYGEKHAVWHPELPPVANVGFLVGGEVFHPGDALTVPDVRVNTLLAPTDAPWLRVADLIRYVREVRPDRLFSIHDGLVNEIGLQVVDSIVATLGKESGADAQRIPPGESVEL